MSEFNNRIDAQRQILAIVNRSRRFKEELFGLSSGALERWMRASGMEKTDALLVLLMSAAERLFFLSNKSQEQVTEDYQSLSLEVSNLTDQIRTLVLN